MPFRETREMLLLPYDGKIISDEEFLVLWESCHSKNPDFRTLRMQDLISKTLRKPNVWQREFRVQTQDIPVLANVLQLPMSIRCPQKNNL